LRKTLAFPSRNCKPVGEKMKQTIGRPTAGRRHRKLSIVSIGVAFLALMAVTNAHAANGSVVYTYDALGRVVSASYDTNVIVYYSYDANGNRTQQVINVNTSTLTWTATTSPCTGNCWGAGLW
jgi:YD repeat-containing protein